MKVEKILIPFLFFTAFSCQQKSEETEERQETEYKKYVPLDFDGDNIFEDREMLTEEHKQNVIQVLTYYGENWKIENEELMIASNIDREMVWNYTSKANDSTWLAEHTIE